MGYRIRDPRTALLLTQWVMWRTAMANIAKLLLVAAFAMAAMKWAVTR